MFVRQVVNDMREYESVKYELDLRLDVLILFLREFQTIVFKDPNGLIYSADLDPAFPLSIDAIIRKLSKDLSEYRDARVKYLEENPESKAALERSEANIAVGVGANLVAVSPDAQEKIKREKWYKKLKKSAFWALFGKEHMIDLVKTMEEWTDRLRNILAIAMQKVQWMRMSVTSGQFEATDAARALGMVAVAKKQRLVANPPSQLLAPLSGTLDEQPKAILSTGGLNIMRYIDKTNDGESTITIVAVERKSYGSVPDWVDPSSDPEVMQALEAVRDGVKSLATLLFNAYDEDDPFKLNVLRCLGYVESDNEATFVFKIPTGVSASSAITLHQLIEQADSADNDEDDETITVSLGDKFKLAYELALGASKLHACGWVHKSIRSKSILIFPSSDGRLCGKENDTISYLTGFEYARQEAAASNLIADYDLSRNLYRHPDRQNDPTEKFGKIHDLYAVGVVLLEIGLWETVTKRFKKQIRDTQASGKQIPGAQIQKRLIKAAQELEEVMGTKFQSAVLACLRSDFGDNFEIGFQNKVLDVLEFGCRL